MPGILIVTGAPGTGKTTLARTMAEVSPHGAHIPADLFLTFPAHPVSPYRPAAREQNADIMVALSRTAAAFAGRGYEVVLEGIIGPWFLPLIAEELYPAGSVVDYVVLQASLETCLERVRHRSGARGITRASAGRCFHRGATAAGVEATARNIT